MKKAQKSNKKQYLCSGVLNNGLSPFVTKQAGFFYFLERSKKSDEKSAKVKQKAVSLQRFHNTTIKPVCCKISGLFFTSGKSKKDKTIPLKSP